MSNPTRGVRGVRASTRRPVIPSTRKHGDGARLESTTVSPVRNADTRLSAVSLTFRDQLRIEYDGYFRELCLRLSAGFDRLPSAVWNGVRRNPARAEHPWGRFLVLLDDAIRGGAREEDLLEAPAILTAYIRTRCAMRYTTPASGIMTIPDDGRAA